MIPIPATLREIASFWREFIRKRTPSYHRATHAQRAPVQVAPIVLRQRLRHHPKAALSRHQMLQAQRQHQHQPVRHDQRHQNC